MSTIKRPLIIILALLLVFGLALTGCNVSKEEESSKATEKPVEVVDTDTKTEEETPAVPEVPENVTITFANFSGGGDKQIFLDSQLAAFAAKYPYITVEAETVGYGDYFVQMQTRIASDTAPDAYELNYENFVSYATRDALLPLDDIIVSSGVDTSVINATALAAFSANGIQYGLPLSFSNVILAYNKDLFDQAGIDYPTNEWTWAEEQVAAESIAALGDNIFGIHHSIHFWEFYKVIEQNGGSLFNEDKTAFTVNSPQNVETLQFMCDRILDKNVMASEAQLAGMGDGDLFKTGRLGMIVTGIWSFSGFASDCDFAWDIEVEPGNLNKATHFFSNGVVLNAATEEADAAFKLAAFLSADKVAALIRVGANWELPAVTDPDVIAAYKLVTPPENKDAVFESLNYLVTPPILEQMQEVIDILGISLGEARDGIKTAQEALDEAQAELEAAITLN